MRRLVLALVLVCAFSHTARADVIVCRAEWENPITRETGKGEWVSANVIFIEIDLRKKLYPSFLFSFSCKRLYDV
jgi:hypothetical protein